MSDLLAALGLPAPRFLVEGAALASSGAAAFALIAAATLVSEDLTCITVGLLAARGDVGLIGGIAACVAGIWAGDMLLFAAGRLLGRAALGRWPLARALTPARLERASAWLERRGLAVVALSRFTPGARLPTYFAAGMLETRVSAFAGHLLLAAVLWTPILVGGSWLAAGAGGIGTAGMLATGAAAALLLAVVRSAPALASRRGRRLAWGRWQRLRRWEFWPLPVLYAPIVAYVAWLAVKYRSLTLPTAANPGIPGGGFAGESKYEILASLGRLRDAQPKTTLVPRALPIVERLAHADAFVRDGRLRYPIVAKPDLGERGAGVAFPASREALARYLEQAPGDVILQEYVPGLEFGVFYVRHPDEPRGRIVSLTAKVLPVLRGDGERTLEQLILDDPRAVCMARTHLERFAGELERVPAEDEEIRLVDVGTHSRGALFLDAEFARTSALEATIERIARACPGFHFGRFDVRVPSLRDLCAGRNVKVLELNGLTAEATHVYHPGTPLRSAYRVLFAQWRLAFEIGRANRGRGARPATLRELARLVRRRSRARRGGGETTDSLPASHPRAA
jgi:membrane protein DedA with SNARE-associated domain